MKKLTLLLALIMLYGCHPDAFPGKSLGIRNNTSERVYFWYERRFEQHHYPDTLLPLQKPLLISSVSPNNTAGAGSVDPDWQAIFAKLPEGKLTIYFFDTTATTQQEWEDLRENHLLLRKDVTLEALQGNDYLIAYP